MLQYHKSIIMKHRRITSNPSVLLGKPIIKGTRIPVEIILRKLSEGTTTADLLDAYPNLSTEDISAVLDYAADVISNETVADIEA